ncbi:MAG: YheV family putative zinc ribbon protein [Motiliproteus sp.]
MTITKRFIAGAVCPRCGELDKLRLWRDDIKEYRECVQCDYQDAMRLDGRNDPEELVTRVNQPVPESSPSEPSTASDEQVLTFVPMKAKAPTKH